MQISIVDRIRARAAKAPDALAASGGGSRLSYGELDRRSNGLARWLSAKGVRAEVPVALLMEPSPDFAVAALAVWKAGGAYLSPDPSLPDGELGSILDDAAAPVAITHRRLAAGIGIDSRFLADLDVAGPEIFRDSGTPLPAACAPDDLAFIAYAAEAGRYRGIEFNHRSLTGMVDWHHRAFGVTSMDRASQSAPAGACESLWEIWPYLAAGASVHFAEEGIRNSPALLRSWISAERITAAFAPSGLAAAGWPGHPPRFVLTPAAGRSAQDSMAPLTVATYGPPECLSMALCGGEAAAGSRVYVLDENMYPAELGVEGDLYVAGTAVARGYRNAPGLTAMKFGPDSSPAGGRCFKTGERARVLPNGRVQPVDGRPSWLN